MSGIGAVTPVNSIQIAAPVANQTRREGLRRAEQEVLRQEMALRNSGDVTSTVYHFSVGPDGKAYISGATVTIRTTGEEQAGGKTPASGRGQRRSGLKERGKRLGEEATAETRLKAIEQDVIATKRPTRPWAASTPAPSPTAMPPAWTAGGTSPGEKCPFPLRRAKRPKRPSRSWNR